MAEKRSQFSEDNRDWFVWTVRDEIYAIVRDYARPIVTGLVIAMASAVIAYIKSHPSIALVIGSVTATAALILGMAFYSGRKARRTGEATGERFQTWMSDMASDRGYWFVSVRITNLGPPTSIHTWQGGYRNPKGGNVYLSDRMLLEEDVAPPENIRAHNLRRDYRRLETGATHEGWIALPAGPAIESSSIHLEFKDALDDDALHEISIGSPRAKTNSN
ncbi:MAG: hypothetical protein ACLQDV_01930 [Candidatus Binataceae bacterium]